MGNRLFGANIAKELKKAFSGSKSPTITLTRIVEGARAANDLGGAATLTKTNYSCKGFVEAFKATQIDGKIILQNDLSVLIIGDTLPSGIVPVPEWQITAEGATYTIVGVSRDPDAATYTCHVRTGSAP